MHVRVCGAGMICFLRGDKLLVPISTCTTQCLRLYFKTVFYGGDGELISQLVPVILERIIMLYSIPSFQDSVRR